MARLADDRQFGAGEAGAVLNHGQAKAGRDLRGVESRAVVGDPEAHPVRREGHFDGDGVGVGVADGIGCGFLRHAEEQYLRVFGEFGGNARAGEGDGDLGGGGKLPREV